MTPRRKISTSNDCTMPVPLPRPPPPPPPPRPLHQTRVLMPMESARSPRTTAWTMPRTRPMTTVTMPTTMRMTKYGLEFSKAQVKTKKLKKNKIKCFPFRKTRKLCCRRPGRCDRSQGARRPLWTCFTTACGRQLGSACIG